jgi:hypothetical protein
MDPHLTDRDLCHMTAADFALVPLPDAAARLARSAARDRGIDTGEEAGLFIWPDDSGQVIAYRGEPITGGCDWTPDGVWLAIPRA